MALFLGAFVDAVVPQPLDKRAALFAGDIAAASHSTHTLAADLNARFRFGHPTNRLAEAGILVHVFDDELIGCSHSEGDAWTASCSEHDALSDRKSVSLINRQMPHIFAGLSPHALEMASEYELTQTRGGMLLSSELLEPAVGTVFCAYHADAHSHAHLCNPKGNASASCIPGCPADRACSATGSQGVEGRPCWWPPHQLREMMEQYLRVMPTTSHVCGQLDCSYNELVMDALPWAQKMPRLIQAFFFPAGSLNGEEHAREVRRTFLNSFPGTYAPLLRLNLSDVEAPFAMVEERPA
jgi:hypothetical protein